MADRFPVYRLTLFQPPNQDATETTPLVPAGTAPHGDAFRVSTAPVLFDDAGLWKPYLAMPRGGRHARIDPIECSTDIGSWTAEISDVALANDDAVRWLSAFMGDAQGRDQLLGVRAQREVSYDGGLTWTNDFGGRVQDVKGDGRIGWSIPIRDEPDRLDVEVFVDRPPATVTNAWQQPLLPLGRLFGVPAGTDFSGAESVWATSGHYQAMHFHAGASLHWRLKDLTEDEKYHWIVPQGLVDLATDDLWVATGRLLTFQAARVYVDLQDAGGVTQGRMWIRRIWTTGFKDGHQRVTSLDVESLAVTDDHYLAPPAEDTVLYGAIYPARGPSAASPIVIGKGGRVNLVTLAGDILDGKFGRYDAAGNPIDVIRRNTASFTALATSLAPLGLLVVKEKTTAKDILTDRILKPLELVLVPDATGALDIVSLQRPTAPVTGLLAITDADLVGTEDAERWSVEDRDRTNIVQLHLYEQGHVTVQELSANTDGRYVDPPLLLLGFPEQPPTLISAAGDARAATAKPKLLELDYGAFLADDGLRWGTQRATDQLARFALGPRYVTYKLRRGTQHDAIAMGDRRLLQTSGVPDPATHQRGLDRIGLCIDVTPNDNDIDVVFLDEGLNTASDVPDLGALSLADGTIPDTVIDPYHIAILDSPVADLAGHPIEIQVALTNPGDPAPSATDPRWSRYRVLYNADGTDLVFLMLFPQGKVLYVRGRSLPDAGEAEPLPSEWVYPTPDHVTLDVRTAWSGLAISNITAHTAHLTWTPGSVDLLQRIYLDDVLVATVPAGSTAYDLTGLAANTNYDVAVVGADAGGGETAATTANFTTLNVNTGIPAPNGLQVVVPSAITLKLFWSDPSFPGTLERAPDDGTGTAPDAGSSETIADGIAGGTATYTDPQPVDGTIWWYRFAQGSGGIVGPWTAWAKAVAQSGDAEATEPPTSSSSAFILAGAVPASLPNGRQLKDGTGTKVNAATPGEVAIDLDPDTLGAVGVTQATDEMTLWDGGATDFYELVGITTGYLMLEYVTTDDSGTFAAVDGTDGPKLSLQVAGTQRGAWVTPESGFTGAADDVLLRLVAVDADGNRTEISESMRRWKFPAGIQQVRIGSRIKRAGAFATDPECRSFFVEFNAAGTTVDPPPDPDLPPDPGPIETTGLINWFQADAEVTDDGSGGIASWGNQGAGSDLTAGTDHPQLEVSGSLTAVRFGGYFEFPSGEYTGRTAGHLFMLLKSDSLDHAASNSGFCNFGPGDSRYGWGGDLILDYGTDTAKTVDFGSFDITAWHVLEIECDGSTYIVRLNGTEYLNTANASVAWATVVAIGTSNFAGGINGDFLLREMIEYGSRQSSAVAGNVRDWLYFRGGITP